MKHNSYDVIIIGGGAAGLFCASQIAKNKKKVLILERSNKVGKKVLMSGGGRCNFTNMYVEPENYLSQNPHFCKSALQGFSQWDFIEIVEQHQIPYHEKKLGQLFCDNSSKDILKLLLSECEKYGAEIKTHCDITSLDYHAHYQIETSLGIFEAETLVIASGGLSIPTMGASSFGYQVAEQFGLKVLPTYAGLVPFTFSDAFKNLSNKISGLSLEAEVSNQLQSFRESILFTHRGLSGPAALQLSSYWQTGECIFINLIPDISAPDWLLECKFKQAKSLLKTLLNEKLPKNLVVELESLWWPKQARTPMAEMSNQQLIEIGKQLNAWKLKPSGTEGYRTAEVTLGGVDTDELSSKTMECKHQSDLFFIGEVLDVTGHLGGFNFQWAWSSAYAAAKAIGASK